MPSEAASHASSVRRRWKRRHPGLSSFLCRLLRRYDDHDDQRQDGKEQAEDPPAERIAALHRGDDRAHDGADDAADRDEYPLDAPQDESRSFWLTLRRQH